MNLADKEPTRPYQPGDGFTRMGNAIITAFVHISVFCLWIMFGLCNTIVVDTKVSCAFFNRKTKKYIEVDKIAKTSETIDLVEINDVERQIIDWLTTCLNNRCRFKVYPMSKKKFTKKYFVELL